MTRKRQKTRPPDGLLAQLRELAGSLFCALYFAQTSKLDTTECWDRWPVDIRGILDTYRKLPFTEDIPSFDSKDAPVIPELKPICNILRCQVRSTTKGYSDYDEDDLAAVAAALSLPATTIWSGVRDGKDRPPYLMLNAPPLRIIAEILLQYSFLLTTDSGLDRETPTHGLHNHNPIAVCVHCDGLFIRARADGQYCSTECRVKAWGEKQGREYFRRKQAEYRASLKEQEARIIARRKKK